MLPSRLVYWVIWSGTWSSRGASMVFTTHPCSARYVAILCASVVFPAPGGPAISRPRLSPIILFLMTSALLKLSRFTSAIGLTAVISIPSEKGLRAIAILIDPICTTVTPRFSISMNPSGWRLARSRISCAIFLNSKSFKGCSRIFTRRISLTDPLRAIGGTRSLR